MNGSQLFAPADALVFVWFKSLWILSSFFLSKFFMQSTLEIARDKEAIFIALHYVSLLGKQSSCPVCQVPLSTFHYKYWKGWYGTYLPSLPLSWGWPRDSSSQQVKSKSCSRPYWRPFAFGWKGRCFPSPFPPTLNAACLSIGSNKEEGGKSKKGRENGPQVVGPLTRVSSCITKSGLCLHPPPANQWTTDKHIDANMEYGFERVSG